MAIRLNIATGRIDDGETKVLTITPKDGKDPVNLSELEVTFKLKSKVISKYTISDFTVESNSYKLTHTFSGKGSQRIEIKAVDGNGTVEKESGIIKVY